MNNRPPPAQPGDGMQPMEYELKFMPHLQRRCDLVVAVDKAIQRRDVDAMETLRARLVKERHGHLLVKKIDEVL